MALQKPQNLQNPIGRAGFADFAGFAGTDPIRNDPRFQELVAEKEP